MLKLISKLIEMVLDVHLKDAVSQIENDMGLVEETIHDTITPICDLVNFFCKK